MVAAAFLVSARPSSAQNVSPSPDSRLLTPAFWLRVVNAVGGPIQVRLKSEGPWATLGHVTRPAERTVQGFGASRWAQPGTVAATAVHGLRIKVSGTEFGPMFSLVPKQFTSVPDFYGGHIPGDSGIRTDISAGEGIFREWAPLAGSPVFIETGSGPMPMPLDYKPVAGDVFLIESLWPADAPRSITFENHKGGLVTARYPDGKVKRLGKVTQPLRGVGRYDGTSYTGVGAINTNHPGVITVSTAPVVKTDLSEGAPPERRGGFEISPAVHVADQAGGAPQVMGVAPLPGDPGWEGRFPLFGGALGLLWGKDHPMEGFHVEMSVDNGPWESFPPMVGKDDMAFTAKGLQKYLRKEDPNRVVKKGLTAIRITLPPWSRTRAAQAFTAALQAEPKGTPEPTGVYRLVKGVLPVTVAGAERSVSFLVDGAVRATSNDPNYVWDWDTTAEPNGRHWLELHAEMANGDTKDLLQRVLVLNTSRTAEKP